MERFHALTSIYANLPEQKKAGLLKKRRLFWNSNMSAVLLSWKTNMAAVTSCENALFFHQSLVSAIS